SPTMGGPNASSPGLPPRDVPLATFAVSGTAANPMPPVPRQTPLRDLRAEPITAKRELVFGMQMGGMRRSAPSEHPQPQNRHPMMAFTINGQVFDPQRIDTTVSVGSIEEWVLTNITPMDHPVHVHVWPMQLIHTPDRSIQEPEWQDVVNIPPQSSITVRVAFDTLVGPTVYHCHLLDHEELGMMGLLEVRYQIRIMYWATPLSDGILELNGQELTISAAITPDATNIIDALGIEITHECEPTRK